MNVLREVKRAANTEEFQREVLAALLLGRCRINTSSRVPGPQDLGLSCLRIPTCMSRARAGLFPGPTSQGETRNPLLAVGELAEQMQAGPSPLSCPEAGFGTGREGEGRRWPRASFRSLSWALRCSRRAWWDSIIFF